MLEWENLSFYERLYLKEKSEKSLLNFTRIWFELLQGEKMLVNWHHRYICEELDKIIRGGENKNLAIAMPPGGTKTEIVSIHMPAYINMLVQIGELDKFRNLNLSFADTLVKRNSRRTRDIIASKEYQELWPCEFGVNQAEEWQITKNGKVKGETVSRALGGQITGGRGGYSGAKFSGSVNLDDPSKPEDMFSSTKREREHRILKNTVRSRRGDKTEEHPTPFIVVQQRLHPQDTVGFCLNGGMSVDFDLIKVPILVTDDYIKTLPKHIAEQCRKDVKKYKSFVKDGIKYWSYWPKMEGVKQLEKQWAEDEYTFMSQGMQEPQSITGNLIDTADFVEYTEIPWLEGLQIFVDTNSGKRTQKNDYSVFTLCGVTRDKKLVILAIERGKWTPTELQKKTEELWNKWKDCAPVTQRLLMRSMCIEDKQAGQGLIQEIKDKPELGINIMPVQRGQGENKWLRYINTKPSIENNRIMIPKIYHDDGEKISHTTWFNGEQAFQTDWVSSFVSECGQLTEGILMDEEKGYDDQFDTVMDAVKTMLVDTSSNLTSLFI